MFIINRIFIRIYCEIYCTMFCIQIANSKNYPSGMGDQKTQAYSTNITSFKRKDKSMIS